MVLTQEAAAAKPATIAAGSLLGHWDLALPAAGAGVLLALVYLAADYLLLPAFRLRVARRRGPQAVARLMNREGRRLRRMQDALAVAEEHDHSDVGPLRGEVGLRHLAIAMMQREASGG